MEMIIIRVVILSVLLIMMGVLIAGVLFVPEIVFSLKEFVVVAIIGIIGTLISAITFVNDLKDYCNRDREYSLNEYDMSKKVITVEDNNDVKTDTVIFFTLKPTK